MSADTPIIYNQEHAEHLRRKAERMDNLRSQLKQLTQAHQQRPLTLEIGCGHGHWLTAYAQAHPHEFCLGLDLVTHRINCCRKKAARLQLDNCAFLKAEVMETLACLPVHIKLAKSFLLFPDPWPKQKHKKKRLMQPEFLSQLAIFQQPGTHFYLRTDHEKYFDWSHKQLTRHPLWQIDPTLEWPFEEESWFQGILGDYQSMVAVRLVEDDCDENN